MEAFEEFKKELAGLDWKEGLTRDELRSSLDEMPEESYLRLPAEKVFINPEQVIHYLREAYSYKSASLVPPEGAEDIGGPRAWGESTTGRIVNEERHGHGVGSGADSGNTGSGSTQTGTDQAGTPYGEEYDGP